MHRQVEIALTGDLRLHKSLHSFHNRNLSPSHYYGDVIVDSLRDGKRFLHIIDTGAYIVNETMLADHKNLHIWQNVSEYIGSPYNELVLFICKF